MSIPGAGNPLLLGGAAGGYEIERSTRLNASDSAFFSRTPASAGNRKTWTWAGWVKRSKFGSDTWVLRANSGGTDFFLLGFGAGDRFYLTYTAGISGAGENYTSAVFRDPSAWYHLVCAFDSTQATATNRIKFYVNGVQQALAVSNPPTLNADYQVNTTYEHRIGGFSGSYADFYLADIHFIDGQALDPTSFGEFDTNGVWQPKAYSGTYGTNGFKLAFADNSAATATTLGKDSSGNGNNWTPNNLSVTAGAGNDSLVDSPTNYGIDTGAGAGVRGNYCTLNPLDSSATLTDGNLQLSHATTGQYRAARSTIQPGSSGLFYAECTVINATGATVGAAFGLTTSSTSLTSSLLNQAGAWVFYADSNRYIGRNGTYGSFAGTFAANTVLRIAIDLANNRAWIGDATNWYDGSNGTTGNPAAGTNPTFTSLPSSGLFLVCEAAGIQTLVLNCGQRPFAYTAPSGFKALCTQNLPAPTITKPSTVMDVKLYTGNGSTQTISGLGFSPDLVWIKGRASAYSHMLYDAVRGVNRDLRTDTTSAENIASPAEFTAFTSDGFTVATNGNQEYVNYLNQTYVAWTWDAGSSTVTNTSGTISSQVRANPSAGFSIVTYTGNGTNGATVGHGLGVAPSLVIIKNRTSAGNNWVVLGGLLNSLTSNGVLYLNTTGALFSAPVSTAVSSTIFTLTNGSDNNGNTNNMVAYCFAPVAGYSAFGSFVGNGSSNGPFIYTNFRPKWLMWKSSSYSTADTGWVVVDSSRNTYNPTVNHLLANKSQAEATVSEYVDFCSNGFKFRYTDANNNANGQTYIWAAFAESPFALARAR